VVVDVVVVVEPAPSDAPEAAGFSPAGPSVVVAPDAAPSAAGVSAPVAGALTLERLASRASFLAQPDPLNTMAGADSARFIAPPQRSHAAGPGAEIAWITSTTWPHDAQT
jgi:hypothetical protein